jgi:ADP-heptose:LPS heptosyltransferase/GT2 family glycosyltransferase
MRFAISIAVHNNLELTKKCLRSVFACSYGRDYLLIVTDNASTDGTRGYLEDFERDQPNVIVVKNEENLGFGVPHNHALALALARLSPPTSFRFVVLNNDLEVCGRWLEDMADALEKDPKNAICGIAGTCCGIDKSGIGRPSKTPEYVEASCLMIRADLAQKHGLFSPDFQFAYYEDSDLSLRMRQLGYRITFVPLPIKHQGAATAKIVADVDLKGFYLRNQKMFLSKWKDYLECRGFGTKSIMVVRDGALGDVILTTPVVRALREKYPNAEISVVTGFSDVYKRNPNVQYVGRKMLKQSNRYNLFFDLNMAYENDPGVHIVEAYAKVCGVRDAVRSCHDAILPDVYPDATDLEWAGLALDGGPWAAIHPGPTAWPGRNWAHERFLEVAGLLMERGVRIVLVGGPDAYHLPCDLDLRGKTSFHQLAALMTKATLFVGIDSAPMHLAMAARKPVVAVFGMIDPLHRLSGDVLCIGVTAPKNEVGCLGCHHYLPAPRVVSECFREPSKTPLCMEKLRVEDVMRAIEVAMGWTHE